MPPSRTHRSIRAADGPPETWSIGRVPGSLRRQHGVDLWTDPDPGSRTLRAVEDLEKTLSTDAIDRLAAAPVDLG